MRALLVVDMQNDFMPGGALAVEGADALIPEIDKLMQSPHFDLIIASRDWHPVAHCSFASTHGKEVGERISWHGHEQILWPDHCVQGTLGAELADSLHSRCFDHLIDKGTGSEHDSYSAFYDNEHKRATGLAAYLREHHVDELYVAGVATDYCVKYTVLDALRLNFPTTLIASACRAVNLDPGDEERAISTMKEAGATVLLDFWSKVKGK